MPESTLPKTYDFSSVEERIYEWWEKSGYFKPTNDPQSAGFDATIKPFVISIPPPNVTGELHLGHAMFVSMEDLMIRYQRMKGVPALWVPGTDHAGIAMPKSERGTRSPVLHFWHLGNIGSIPTPLPRGRPRSARPSREAYRRRTAEPGACRRGRRES